MAIGLGVLAFALVAQAVVGGAAGWIALLAAVGVAAAFGFQLVERSPAGLSSSAAHSISRRGWARVVLVGFIGLVLVLVTALILQAALDSRAAGWVALVVGFVVILGASLLTRTGFGVELLRSAMRPGHEDVQ